MGLVDNLMGTGKSGFFLGITAVIAVVTYSYVRSSGLPIVGSSGNGGSADVFGGQ